MINKFKNSFASKPALLTLSTLSLLIDAVIRGIINPAIPEILQVEMKSSTNANGFLVGCYGLGVLIGAPFISYLSDRSGKRKIYMFAGFLVLGVSSLGIGLSKQIYQIFLARFGQGIASGITRSLGLASLIDIYPPDKLDFSISMVYSGLTLGTVGGPFIGGIVYSYRGKMGISYAMIGFSLLNMVARILVPDSEQLRQSLEKSDQLDTNSKKEIKSNCLEFTENNIETNVSDPVITNKNREEKADTKIRDNTIQRDSKINFFDFFKEHQILAVCAVTIIAHGGTSSMGVILPIYLSDKFRMDSKKIGYTLIGPSVSGIIGGLIFGRLTEMDVMTKIFGPNKKRYFVILGGNFLAGLFIIFLGLNNTVYSVVVIVGFIGFCLGFGNAPVMTTFGSHISLMLKKRETLEKTSRTRQGANSQIYSLYNISHSVGFLVIPILASIIYNSKGFLVVNVILGVFMLVITVLSMGSVLIFSKGR
ncbi:hypothetical protein BB559_005982 [Furculomyces boomerangus]|uniref:Major facilitator superfamily (MFS) profile domain-containing protein n=1 Tax=Furculomyces boomerangus TaxID=61424 RepID=A0A2T9Y5G4_9FUNG|nr:hypothetical protein BB559_005982 [Furculomyces boomerangus]